MNQRGLEVDTVAPRMRFAVTVGTDFFMEIAKLRALRMLWSRAVAALGGSEKSQTLSLHVRTSQWNKTVNDPHNNLLRAAVEAFAGVLGGCDSMQVGAFDEVIRPPDDFSLRIARNMQLILQKECSLDQVIDPAGGSWFVETVTAELAGRAWAMFQEVEKLGGMAAALRVGFPQQAVAATAAEKNQAVRRRRNSIIGVNQYANAKELPLEVPAANATAFYKRRVRYITSHRTSFGDEDNEIVLKKLSRVFELKGVKLFEACVEAVGAGATLGEISRAMRINDGASATITPVHLARAAAPFEVLRTAMDRYSLQHQGRPAVFLCNLGPLRDYKARADFSRGFFACGGYDVISSGGFETPGDAAKAFINSGARVAVICSADDRYPMLVPPLVASIRSKCADAIIVLAGFPPDQIDAHKKAGVDEFIHVRADAVELLAQFHRKLGIQS
jgi:methylmalonyl-CoA mutase